MLKIVLPVIFGILILVIGYSQDADALLQWDLLETNYTERISDISCVDENICYALGQDGINLKTTDGGNTWDLIDNHTDLVFDGVDFVDANIGFALAVTNDIYKTTDGGITWNISFDESAFMYDISCVDENICYATTFSSIFKTSDGGTTWNNVFSADFLEYIDCFDSNHCKVVGSEFDGSAVASTSDGGETWDYRTSNTEFFSYNDINCYGPNVCQVTYFEDDGIIEEGELGKVSCIEEFWCVGLRGSAIMEKIDSFTFSPTSWPGSDLSTLHDIECLDNRECYIVGDNGAILKGTVSTISCGEGTTLNEITNECEADAGTPVTCGTGTELVTGQCELNQQTIEDLAALTTCNGDLSTCNASLSTCSGDLSTCSGNLGTANTDLDTCNASLSTCSVDLGTANTNLGLCNTDLSTAQGDLGSCQTELAMCVGETAPLTEEECADIQANIDKKTAKGQNIPSKLLENQIICDELYS